MMINNKSITGKFSGYLTLEKVSRSEDIYLIELAIERGIIPKKAIQEISILYDKYISRRRDLLYRTIEQQVIAIEMRADACEEMYKKIYKILKDCNKEC